MIELKVIKMHTKTFKKLNEMLKSQNNVNSNIVNSNNVISNNTIIYLDRYIDSPYYLQKKSIWVFREKIAVELVLFSGDVSKYSKAKQMANRPL
jgi:hypothetical protein